MESLWLERFARQGLRKSLVAHLHPLLTEVVLCRAESPAPSFRSSGASGSGARIRPSDP
jgi:hypothetical protein